MAVPLTEGAQRIIDKPNIAHLATMMADGAPLVSPVWVQLDGNQIVFSTRRNLQEMLNVESDPRVALSIADIDSPYPPVQIRGKVVEMLTGLAALDRFVKITLKYTGTEPEERPPTGELVAYKIDPLAVVAPDK